MDMKVLGKSKGWNSSQEAMDAAKADARRQLRGVGCTNFSVKSQSAMERTDGKWNAEAVVEGWNE